MDMRHPSTGWPEGLSDREALVRLRTLCLGACDGVQDLADDTRYKALRRSLLARSDLRPLHLGSSQARPKPDTPLIRRNQ